VLTHLDPASSLAVGLLIFSFVLVIAFEASNGFHDTANAVATVIYTKSLPPVPAVIWSGLMNFLGVLIGGIAVAYALVELLPPDVRRPQAGRLRSQCSLRCFSLLSPGMSALGGSVFQIPAHIA
jgi:PiT family inorganic phosphate transporter